MEDKNYMAISIDAGKTFVKKLRFLHDKNTKSK